MELSVSSFFAEYMIHPFSPELSQKDRVTATIASIVVGILTLGIGHVVCSALRSRQIRHLRQKLEDDDRNPRYIETVRGIGYRFNNEAE